MIRRLSGPHRRRASTLIFVAVTAPLMLGFAALTIDVGHMYNVRADLQNAADAASLAGAAALTATSGPNWTEEDRDAVVTQRAVDIVERNLAMSRGPSADTVVEVGRWDSEAGTFDPTSAGDGRRTNAVRVAVTRSEVPYFFAAIFGKNSFDTARESVAAIGQNACRLWARKKAKLKEKATTDSYDSSAGPYDSFSAGSEGHVCSCGSLEVKGQYLIDGDALYGEGAKNKGDFSDVTGEYGPLSECLDPTLVWGGVLVDNLSINLTDDGDDPFEVLNGALGGVGIEWIDEFGDDLLPEFLGDFSGFNPDKLELHIHKGELTLPPGTYYFKKMKLHKKSTLTLTGPTTLYIEKELDIHDSTIVNPSQDPLDLMIYSPGKKIHLKNAEDFYAYILAPNAKVKIEKRTELFGAVIGKEVEIKKGGAFHADVSIPMGEIPDRPVLVR